MSVLSQKRFIQEALDAHNSYRKDHDVSELEHDTKLSDLAMDWAEHLANTNTLQYRNSLYKNEPLGENIIKVDKFYLAGDLISKIWYKESSIYDGTFNPSTGHFTQMVWKNTRKVGYGYASREDGQFYAVAFYYPAGNYKNEFKENVLPLSSKTSKSENQNTLKGKETKPVSNFTSKILPIKDSGSSAKEEPRKNTVVPKYNQFSDAQQRFINEALDTHNKCRRRHCVEPLVHNPELSKIAQQYANQLAKSKALIHSKNKYQDKNLGENLAYSYDSTLNYYSGEKATMQWYDEIKQHNFDLDYQRGTGHFTQLVWKASKEVGFGVAMASDGSFYAVANYFPAGNLLGTFVKNVPKPL